MSSPRKSSRLQLKGLPNPSKEAEALPCQPKPKTPRMTEAERAKLYRQRIKQDPEAYAALVAKNKERCAQYRSKLDEAEKDAYKQKGRERAKLSHSKKKAKLGQDSKRVTRADQVTQDAMREKWREDKKKSRAAMHWKTRDAINAKRREAYHIKKSSACNSTFLPILELPAQPSPVSDTRTPAAKRKACQRARSQISKNPAKYVGTVLSLIKSASPRKKRLFADAGLDPTLCSMGSHFVSAVRCLQRKNIQVRHVLLGVLNGYRGSSLRAAQLLNVGRKNFKCNKERKKLGRKQADTSCASTFLESCATVMPDKKLVSKKSGKAAAFLQMPLKEVYKKYVAAGGTISFSTFAKCRPKNVRLMSQAKLRQCLCEYCTNVSLKLQTVKTTAISLHLNRCIVGSERDAVALITCSVRQKRCCYGDCEKCGLGQLDEHLKPLLDINPTLPVKWYRWDTVKRSLHGKQVSRKCLLTSFGELQTLVQELRKELQFLAQHLFRADWQHHQFSLLRQLDPFPAGTTMMVLDFAENFACQYQDEVQAAHWHHEQATVHPIITYYRCPACPSTTTESLVFVSADTKHDYQYHAVQHFVTAAMRHLRIKRALDLRHVIQWTDGCASQYKSKGPFSDISRALEDLGVTLERNFFGSRHGKGPSDGESAVVKHHASTAVAAGSAIICNAAELFQFLENSTLKKQPPVEGCVHSLRTFFWVGEDVICRDRPDRHCKTIKGTRSLHSVKCLEKGAVLSRHLTCVCSACLLGVGACTQMSVTGEWEKQTFGMPSPEQDSTLSSSSTASDTDLESSVAAGPLVPELETGVMQTGLAGQVECVRSLQKGDWIKVAFETARDSKEYSGKVLEVDGMDVHVRFLRDRGYFTFPLVEDQAWIHSSQIICVLGHPTISGRDQYVFD